MSAPARTYRHIVARELSTNFRAVTSIVTKPFPTDLPPKAILVKNKFLGINASDINFTAGTYLPDVSLPFACGFEAIGEVVEVGSGVTDLKNGQAVVTQSYGAFSEYQVVARRRAKVIPRLAKEFLPLDLSATTASIALEHVLKPQRGERAIVTAAAGGTGQFAVQLLKNIYGCSVVGTCSSKAKEEFLARELKCDGVVNYKTHEGDGGIAAAFQRCFPRGTNIAYESVGGDLLDAVVQNLALRGRILSLGYMSVYQSGSVEESHPSRRPLPLQLLAKSASLHTFFLPHFAKYEQAHFDRLCTLYEEGKIGSFVDPTPFKGLEAVSDALDWMFQQKNCGKVLVEL